MQCFVLAPRSISVWNAAADTVRIQFHSFCRVNVNIVTSLEQIPKYNAYNRPTGAVGCGLRAKVFQLSVAAAGACHCKRSSNFVGNNMPVEMSA